MLNPTPHRSLCRPLSRDIKNAWITKVTLMFLSKPMLASTPDSLFLHREVQSDLPKVLYCRSLHLFNRTFAIHACKTHYEMLLCVFAFVYIYIYLQQSVTVLKPSEASSQNSVVASCRPSKTIVLSFNYCVFVVRSSKLKRCLARCAWF